MEKYTEIHSIRLDKETAELLRRMRSKSARFVRAAIREHVKRVRAESKAELAKVEKDIEAAESSNNESEIANLEDRRDALAELIDLLDEGRVPDST